MICVCVYEYRLVRKRFRGTLPSFPLRLVKGHAFVVACRGFAQYAAHPTEQRGVAHAFYLWNNATCNPDETYFNSLNHNPWLAVPGAYRGT